MNIQNTSPLSHLSDHELTRSEFIFRMMNSPFAVKLLSHVTLIALKIGIPIESLIKQTIYKQFCGGETIEESEKIVNKLGTYTIKSILDYSVESASEREFEQTINELEKITQLAAINKHIPYTCIKLTGIATVDLLKKIGKKTSLNEKELQQYETVKARLVTICDYSEKHKIPLYIDAEESWLQEAIDSLAIEMMRKYNKKTALVSNTLQMYRKDRLDYLVNLIATAKKENFKLGVKLVRGAYWETEMNRAISKQYPVPVFENKSDSDNAFDLAAKICIDNLDSVTVCIGTHNEQSVYHVMDYMNQLKIQPNNSKIYFSQLYGMSDNISYQLANQNYNITKYLPYGPVKSVVPYLIRRAEENTSIAGQMGRELKLILQEKVIRRMKKHDYNHASM